MERFYEVAEPEKLASECRRIWGLPDGVNIGPVNTNFPAETNSIIRLVIVCESPSCNEVALGYPTVAATGRNIYYRYCESNNIDLKGKYNFKECYEFFQDQGIYIANLVRCQADYGLPSLSEKNRRVKSAWTYNRIFLQEELLKILSLYPNACVLFACGSEFKKQIEEAIKIIEDINSEVDWLVSFHPSRLKSKLAWHYNHSKWRSHRRTWPKERDE